MSRVGGFIEIEDACEVTWALNQSCTKAFDLVYSPMSSWPAWLSLGVISAVVGVIMLLAYKYTSWQSQIAKARDEIKANMLSMKLFKDNLGVTFAAQGAVMWSSFKILMLSIPPIAVAMIPMVPLLAQMAGRYQFKPLAAGEPSPVKVWLSEEFGQMEKSGQAELSIEGPEGVRFRKFWRNTNSTEAHWEVVADEPGQHLITLHAGDQTFTKQLPVGEYGSITSAISPKWINHAAGILDNPVMLPWEKPSDPNAHARAIEVTEILRDPAPDVIPIPILGNWIVYFLIVSIVFALIFKPFFNVRI